MEHDSTGPEPSGVNRPDEVENSETDVNLASRLRELEEEAERLRRQIKEQEAVAEQPAPDKKKPEADEPSETAAVGAKVPAAADEVAEPPQPPLSPEMQAEAESLVRQAQVAKMRGQTRPAMDLLVQAEKLAPNLPLVLEALGDELAGKSRWKDARAVYGRACKVETGNVALERKYAQAVLKASLPVEALLMGVDNTASMMEQAANAKLAAIWSFILPGVGQIVLGETAKGIGFLLGWLGAWTVAVLIPNGLKGLVSVIGTGKDTANMIVLLPIVVALILWLSSIYDASAHAKTVKKQPVERPTPPVNLPFE